MRVEILGGGDQLILIPLQVVDETVFAPTRRVDGGGGGACTITRGIVEVRGDDTSLGV